MPNAFYAPKPMSPIPDQTSSPLDAMKATQGAADNQVAAVKSTEADGAAQAFQKHLDAGYTAMVSTLKELPPEVAAGIPSPEAYADSEDKRVAWYMTVNDAVAKSNLLKQTSAGTAEPDALKNAAAASPMGPDSQKAVGASIDRMEEQQTGKKIQGLFDTTAAGAAAPAAPALAPNIDPRSQFGRGLKIKMAAMAPHADTITAASAKAGIQPALVMAVAAQESAGDPSATSSTGVKGTMQVTNGTFKDMASKYPDAGLTDRTDPAQSYTAGSLYLGELVKEFDGNIPAALGAYNAGPTAIHAAMKKYPDDWAKHLDEFLPADKAEEASNYITSVSKNLSALGGSAQQAPASNTPNTDFAKKVAMADPKLLNDPRVTTIGNAVKEDAANAIKSTSFQTKIDQSNQRIDLAKQRLKNTLDYQAYQKVDKYGTAIKDIAPAAMAIKRIDQLAGGLDGTGDIAGVGIGANMFKKFLMTDLSPEARDMRLALADLFPKISHEQFGSRLTSTEVGLLGQQLGTSWLSDADTFRKAMRQQRDDVWQKMNDKWAALPDDAKKELYDQGVANPDMFGDFHSPVAGKDALPGAAPKTAASGKGFTPEKANRLAELKAKQAAGTLK